MIESTKSTLSAMSLHFKTKIITYHQFQIFSAQNKKWIPQREKDYKLLSDYTILYYNEGWQGLYNAFANCYNGNGIAQNKNIGDCRVHLCLTQPTARRNNPARKKQPDKAG